MSTCSIADVAHVSTCRVDTRVDICRPVKKCRDESRHGTHECVRHTPAAEETRKLIIWGIATGPGRTLLDETDGTWRSGARPSTGRARRRAFRRLPSCIRNKWDENGRLTAA